MIDPISEVMLTKQFKALRDRIEALEDIVKDWWILGPEKFERKYALLANLSSTADEFVENAQGLSRK